MLNSENSELERIEYKMLNEVKIKVDERYARGQEIADWRASGMIPISISWIIMYCVEFHIHLFT